MCQIGSSKVFLRDFLVLKYLVLFFILDININLVYENGNREDLCVKYNGYEV
jgi:hypothetical protein